MPPYNGRYNPQNYHYPHYNSHVPHPPYTGWRHGEDDAAIRDVFDVKEVFNTVVSTVKSIVEEAAASTEQQIIPDEKFDGYGYIDETINSINGNGQGIVTDTIYYEEATEAVKEVTEKSLIYEHTTPWVHVPHILFTDNEHWDKKEPESNPYIILIIILAVLVVLAAVILAVYTYCKKKRNLADKEDSQASIIGKTYSGKKLSAQKSDPQKIMYGGGPSSKIDPR